ncbi:MAG: hypothetical protein PHQ05_01275 [Sterolibacterium sp.]|nr:hypothetical protein [Sterolibacterium sp.]
MFHVLDHADVVYSGDLSQLTQYVTERYDKNLDEAIRSGIKIIYTDPRHSLSGIQQTKPAARFSNFWEPIEDWELD